MANNITLDPMSGGSIVATEEISAAHFQRVKLALGASGVDDGDVASGNKMPVRASELETLIGEVQASPTANTLLARLKNIEDYTDQIEGYVDQIEGYVDGIEGLLTTIDADTSVLSGWDNAASDGASVSGDVAHDTADAGEPVKVGHKAIAHGSNPTAVAAGDRTDWYAHRHGIPFVIGGHMNAVRIAEKYTAAQTDTILQSISASQIFVVTSIAIYVDNATSVDVQALLEFDDGTDVSITEHPGLASGSGLVEGNGGGILAIGEDGQDLLFTCEVPTDGSITVQVTGYIIES